ARHAGAVFAEAQAIGVAVDSASIATVASALIAGDAADRPAAVVYDFLAGNNRESLPAEAAWLYARAAEREGVRLRHGEVLFERAFRDRAGMVKFFKSRNWEFSAVERLYLSRWAEQHPGSFPTAAGRDYPARAEAALLADSRRLEKQNRGDAAQSVARLALALAPSSPPVYDRLAELAFRRERFEEARERLDKWRNLHPADALPLVRLGLIDHAQGRKDVALQQLRRGLDLAEGSARGPIALAAARIAIGSNQIQAAVDLLNRSLAADA